MGATRSSSESSSSIEPSSDANELLLTLGADTIIAARYTHGKLLSTRTITYVRMFEYCTLVQYNVAPNTSASKIDYSEAHET